MIDWYSAGRLTEEEKIERRLKGVMWDIAVQYYPWVSMGYRFVDGKFEPFREYVNPYSGEKDE